MEFINCGEDVANLDHSRIEKEMSENRPQLRKKTERNM